MRRFGYSSSSELISLDGSAPAFMAHPASVAKSAITLSVHAASVH